jgi:hypothetical protein
MNLQFFVGKYTSTILGQMGRTRKGGREFLHDLNHSSHRYMIAKQSFFYPEGFLCLICHAEEAKRKTGV